MIELLIAGLGLFVGYCFGVSMDECPRSIEGYNCRGDACNHNKILVREAKERMIRNRYDRHRF